MRPSIDWKVLDWADEFHVLKVRLIGTGPDGRPVDTSWVFDEPVTIDEVAKVVAKMNAGNYRAG